MSQFCAFCESASKIKAIEQAALLQAMAIGAQGTEKSIREAVKTIIESGSR